MDKKNSAKSAIYWSLGIASVIIAAIFIFGGGGSGSEVNSVTNNYNNTPASSTPAIPPANPDKDANGCYTPSTVRKHYGENACVDFYATYTYTTSAGTKFIDEKTDYNNGFVVYIPRNSNASTLGLNQFINKNIKVTGYISQYGGHPQIEVTNPDQLSIYK
jgi:hypothetical protein